MDSDKRRLGRGKYERKTYSKAQSWNVRRFPWFLHSTLPGGEVADAVVSIHKRGLKLALRKDGLGYCAGSGSEKPRGRGLESLWLQKLETSNPIGYGLGQALLD